MWLFLPVLVILRLAVNSAFGVYRQIWRYINIADVLRIGESGAMLTAVLFLLRVELPDSWALFRLPITIITIEFFLSFYGTVSLRLMRRIQYQWQFSPRTKRGPKKVRLLLVGADSAGVMAAKNLSLSPGVTPVGFLDDDPKKQKSIISGIPVLGPVSKLREVVKQYGVDEVVLCVGQAPRDTLKRLWRLCEGLQVRTVLIPSFEEMLNGDVQVSRLSQVTMEELLGREAASNFYDVADLVKFYRDKRILITGAGGSIGSEIARQLARMEPHLLLLLDKDENGLHELELQFAMQERVPRYQMLVADIRFVARMRGIFEQFRPEVVFHCAAHKHVPLMEFNAMEAVLNNVFGTRDLVQHALGANTSHFVFISSDKAVEPSSIMGATKRLGELIVRGTHREGADRFDCVRFGNVLGSRGSVIPLFQKQISEGGPITLTDPEVNRYFLTVPEAVNLVMRVAIMEEGRGGTYVLDMGDPIRIADLARDLIELSGLRPDVDIRIENIGLRPGEKMSEQLLGDGETLQPTAHPRIFAVAAPQGRMDGLENLLDCLWNAVQQNDAEAIRTLFREFDFGFRKPATVPKGQ